MKNYFDSSDTKDKKIKNWFNTTAYIRAYELVPDFDENLFKDDFDDEVINYQNIDIKPLNFEDAFYFDRAYYFAVKMLPKKEKKVLYYANYELLPLKEISKVMKLSHSELLKLKDKAEQHLKTNLNLYFKVIESNNKFGGNV